MKLVKYTARTCRDNFISVLSDSEGTNKNVRFDERLGKPTMFVKEKGSRVRINCKYIGGNTRDNGFLEGTYFLGTLREKDGVSTLSGVIWTAPIFHLIMIILLAVSVVQCVYMKGFSPIPLCLAAFDVVMFLNEFKKQGIINRYLARAVRRAEATQNKKL